MPVLHGQSASVLIEKLHSQYFIVATSELVVSTAGPAMRVGNRATMRCALSKAKIRTLT